MDQLPKVLKEEHGNHAKKPRWKEMLMSAGYCADDKNPYTLSPFLHNALVI